MQSVEAVRIRDNLIRRLSLLPPVGSALDQIVQHFGDDAVGEITGRSRRILKMRDERGKRHALRSRAASANMHETHAFMNGEKRILVFSLAGNTGRSYHADLSADHRSDRPPGRRPVRSRRQAPRHDRAGGPEPNASRTPADGPQRPRRAEAAARGPPLPAAGPTRTP